MRDYLKMFEIEDVLIVSKLSDKEVQLIMKTMEDFAEACLCFAHSYNECVCGAWEPDD
jgi:hypothetical protein